MPPASQADNMSAPPPPVVFIHGWKCSRLADEKTGETEYDLTLPVLLGLAKDPALELPMGWLNKGKSQVEDNLVATEPIRSFNCLCGMIKLGNLYGPLLKHLEKSPRDLYIFTYDWRRALGETAVLFEKFLMNVKEITGREPQVISHSMGGLITLSVLNRRPELFHSVLFGAGMLSPHAGILKDLSIVGEKNVIGRNTTMFSPKLHLSHPASWHFLGYSGERELFGKPSRVLFRTEDKKPLEIDLHSLETWKQHRLGMYHPESGVTNLPDPELEEWVQSILDKSLKFRKGLLPANSGLSPDAYPPVSVLRGDSGDTEFGYVLRPDDSIDLREDIRYMRGDGRITLEDTIPPKGIQCCRVVTNNREHKDVLNDIDNVEALLDLMIAEKQVVKKSPKKRTPKKEVTRGVFTNEELLAEAARRKLLNSN